MDIVIYIGIAINIIGAVLLMIYAIKYYKAFKEAERLTVKMEVVKAEWQKKRALSFSLIIGGCLIAIIGCYL